jgi:hypothetical protein
MFFSPIIATGIATLAGPTLSTIDPNLSVKNIDFLLTIPSIIYLCVIAYKLMREYATVERLEMALMKKIRTILADLGAEKTADLTYTPQCKARNFWVHLLLTLPTLYINWLYIDYRYITEPVKRFKEANKVQHYVLKNLKQVLNKNTNRAIAGTLTTASETPVANDPAEPLA